MWSKKQSKIVAVIFNTIENIDRVQKSNYKRWDKPKHIRQSISDR